MGASSSDYSEWNIDDKWSSQEWKSGEMLGARTARPVGGQQFTQETDKFVIDDDDMDSDTATESSLSLKARSFLNRVKDRLRKTLDHSSKDAMQDIDKRSKIWGIFMSSTLEASVFMDKNYSEILLSHNVATRWIRHNFDASVCFDGFNNISEVLERLQHIRTDATSLPQNGSYCCVHHRVHCVSCASHVHFCVIGDSALSLLFPRIHFVLQNKQWKALLRLSPPCRALVNISRITCGIPFWNCSFSSRQAA